MVSHQPLWAEGIALLWLELVKPSSHSLRTNGKFLTHMFFKNTLHFPYILLALFKDEFGLEWIARVKINFVLAMFDLTLVDYDIWIDYKVGR